LVPVDLPDFYRDDLPVSRGAWQHIARLFCFLAGEPEPTTRLEATRLIVRLRDQCEQQAASTKPPPDGRGDPAW